jgi:hypothetical protein
MSAGTFADVWANASDVTDGDAEVIPAGSYNVKLVGAGVSSDRVWTLWKVLTGDLAGSSFFGSKYGLTGGDAGKTAKAQGFFKLFMTSCGVTEQFFANATSLDDFAKAVIGVEGNLAVKYRTYTDKKTGAEVGTNDSGKFEMTARPPLTTPGGLPVVATPQVAPQVAAQPTAPAPLPPPAVLPPPPPAPAAPAVAAAPPTAEELAAAQAIIAAAAPAPVAAPAAPAPAAPGGAISTVAEPDF